MKRFWKIDEVIKKVLYFTLFVYPIGAMSMTINIGSRPLSLCRIGLFALVILLLIKCLSQKKIILCKCGNCYSVIFFFAWLAWAFVSGVWSMNFADWFRAFHFVFIGVIAIVVCNNALHTKQDIINAFVALEWGIIPQMLLGWYEVFTKDYLFITYGGAERANAYSSGSYGLPVAMQVNVCDFGTMMFVGWLLSVICIAYCSKRYAWLYCGCFISHFLLLILHQQRANWLAVIFVIIAVMFAFDKKKLFLNGCLMLVCGYAIFEFFVAEGLNLIDEFNMILKFDFYAGGSDTVRLGLILNGFHFLNETFGFGVGAGQIESWMETRSIYFRGDITNMHNWWMEIMVGYGVLIFVGYCVFYWRTFWKMWDMGTTKGTELRERCLPFCIALIMCGYTIASVSSSSLVGAEYLWFFWAIVIAYQGMLGEEKLKE